MAEKNKTVSGVSGLPKNYPKAFKPYDIRGKYPDELNEEVAYRSAKAFAELFNLKEIAVGRDMRISSPALSKAFIKGARESGMNVIDAGVVDTPLIYYVSGKHKMPGAMITASHNPKEYNGIKLVRKGAVAVSWESGFKKIMELVEKNHFKKAKKRGKLKRKNYLKEYKKYVRRFANINPEKKIKVVVGAGNGMASKIVPLVYKGLKLKITKVHFGLDGSFPNHTPNPTISENRKQVEKKIRSKKADLGISFDGDMDRIVFFDEKGNYIFPSIIGCVIAKRILQKNKGAVSHTTLTSKSFIETIKKYGGKPYPVKVGQSLVKEGMRKSKSLFGVEHSSHFYFKDFYYADSGIIASLIVLEAVAEEMKKGKKMSEIVAEFLKYAKAEERVFKVKDKDRLLKEIEKKYSKKKPEKIDHFDYLTIRFKDFWFNVRKSGTEDAVKLNLEAVNKKIMKEKLEELTKFIKKHSK